MGHWTESLGSLSGAHISECGRYRTLLWRTLSSGDAAPLVFVMLNPSKADALQDDPTIRRCLGFARREGAGGIVVVNLSPWRATDPKDLEFAYRSGDDVLWTVNYSEDALLARSLGPFILAWGAGIRSWMDRAARTMIQIAGEEARCLGKTKKGEPRHPLMVASATPLVAYP